LAKGEWPEDSSEQCGGDADVRAKYEFAITMPND